MQKQRHTGNVKFFNVAKGYGFLAPEDGNKDVFVHVTAVQRSGLQQLDEGMRLSFEIEADANGRGPQAIELQLLDPLVPVTFE